MRPASYGTGSWVPSTCATDGGAPLQHTDIGDDIGQVALHNGESALITARGDRPDLAIAPVHPTVDAPRRGVPRV